MKKTYSKPVIIIENFSLSTNLAADCEKPFTLAEQFACGIPDESGTGLMIFDTSIASTCGVDGMGNEVYDGFCYHIPSESNELFNS